ncbi:small integral membrane protein 20 isoform X1 [Larus michahellis]
MPVPGRGPPAREGALPAAAPLLPGRGPQVSHRAASGVCRKWSHIVSGWWRSAAMAGLSRTLGIFGGFVAVVGAAFYPIYFRPLLLPEEYIVSFLICFPEKEQLINRAGIVQEDIQPAGLKVWSDPFGRK